VSESGQAYWPAGCRSTLADVRLAAPGGFSAGFRYPAFTTGPDSLHVPPRLLVPFAAFHYARASPARWSLDARETASLSRLIVHNSIPQNAQESKSARMSPHLPQPAAIGQVANAGFSRWPLMRGSSSHIPERRSPQPVGDAPQKVPAERDASGAPQGLPRAGHGQERLPRLRGPGDCQRAALNHAG
jgi:hypothetical protein